MLFAFWMGFWFGKAAQKHVVHLRSACGTPSHHGDLPGVGVETTLERGKHQEVARLEIAVVRPILIVATAVIIMGSEWVLMDMV